jgi:hypothetical protein
MIVDVTGSYDLAYYLNGVGISFSGFIMFAIPAYNLYKKLKNDKN